MLMMWKFTGRYHTSRSFQRPLNGSLLHKWRLYSRVWFDAAHAIGLQGWTLNRNSHPESAVRCTGRRRFTRNNVAGPTGHECCFWNRSFRYIIAVTRNIVRLLRSVKRYISEDYFLQFGEMTYHCRLLAPDQWNDVSLRTTFFRSLKWFITALCFPQIDEMMYHCALLSSYRCWSGSLLSLLIGRKQSFSMLPRLQR